MTGARIAWTVAALTLREAARRRVLLALAGLTVVLLALSASSPFWKSEDTGYASCRTLAWHRWPTAGPPAPLSNAEINELGSYFAAQAAEPAGKPLAAGAASAGKALSDRLFCTQCHGAELQGQQHIPRIAGQQAEYLRTQLLGFKAGTRFDMDGNMTAAAQALTDLSPDVLTELDGCLRPDDNQSSTVHALGILARRPVPALEPRVLALAEARAPAVRAAERFRRRAPPSRAGRGSRGAARGTPRPRSARGAGRRARSRPRRRCRCRP